MKITYLHHSGIAVELEHHVLIFDYIEGDVSHYKKPITCFVSHYHQDHYNPEIFNFAQTVVLEQDCWSSKPCINVKANQTITIEDMEIQTLPSTDCGVAYLVTCEGKRIYHAGDLNAWCWPEESEEELSQGFSLENQRMKQEYLDILNHVEEKEVDVAFVPTDPRLMQYQFLGLELFNEVIESKVIFPIHLWGEFATLDEYDGLNGKLKKIHRKGESFLI